MPFLVLGFWMALAWYGDHLLRSTLQQPGT